MENNDSSATRELRPLDERGILAGTDKSSLANDYLRHYERIFAPWRERTFTLLEIGIAQGASLQLWRDYFPHADIVAIDINPKCKEYERERVRIEIGSQDDPEFLGGLFTDRRPEIIIDDGSHRADHILTSFEHLFPQLLPGGLYVIEDLYLHFGDVARLTRGTATTSVPDTIADLVKHLMWGRVNVDDGPGFAGNLTHAVDRLEIISRAVVISKRKPSRPPISMQCSSSSNNRRFTKIGIICRLGSCTAMGLWSAPSMQSVEPSPPVRILPRIDRVWPIS